MIRSIETLCSWNRGVFSFYFTQGKKLELKYEYAKVMKVVTGDHTLALNNLVLAHFSHPYFHCCVIAGRDFVH